MAETIDCGAQPKNDREGEEGGHRERELSSQRQTLLRRISKHLSDRELDVQYDPLKRDYTTPLHGNCAFRDCSLACQQRSFTVS